MPNKRAEGIVVTTFAAPAELLTAARAKAESEGRKLSAIIRDALTKYVEDQ